VWLSEIMLQQTQVTTVIPYYRRFLQRFPDLAALAGATPDDVLAHWSGLGYYSRARNLHRAAQLVMEQHGGMFPHEPEAIAALPGIGRSTAAAIAVFAYGRCAAILDGNVKRIFARHFGIAGHFGEKHTETLLWQHAEALLPEQDIETYTQGLMDLGATLCTRSRPRCDACPLHVDCIARKENLTAQLPTPKPKRVLPQKHITMLVLLNCGEVLLEKRPPAGIWGGLWCLPELPPDADADAYCAQRYGARVAALAPLPQLDHAFTHFKLAITPQPLRVTALQPLAQRPGQVWLTPEDALGAAIPTPVRRILQGVQP
jgi:A/G-specific adenine glycosylase